MPEAREVLPDQIEVMTLFVPDIAEGRVALLNGWVDQPWPPRRRV